MSGAAYEGPDGGLYCEHGYEPGDGHHYWRCTGQTPPGAEEDGR